MSQIQFKKYQRFDQDKAAAGVSLHIVDEVGNDYGTFVTSLFDTKSKFIQVELERFRRKHGNNPKYQGREGGVYAFVELCLHGWDGVLDDKGKPVPFTKEAAFAYLSDPDLEWAAEKLMEKASDVLNYQADPVAQQDDIAKN